MGHDRPVPVLGTHGTVTSRSPTSSWATRAFDARVGALADGSEILVSQTVKDLVAGSGLDFEDRGEHVLKGVPGEWRVFAVR